MKITAVRCAAVAIPIQRPTSISTRRLSTREFVLVWVDTDAGVTGCGYTYAGTLGGRVTRLCVEDMLAPLVVGSDPRQVEASWDRMFKETLLVGRRGAVLRAARAGASAISGRGRASPRCSS